MIKKPAIRKRARQAFGKAKVHKCVDCGKQALDWDHYKGYALKHALTVHPVCRSCHKKRGYKRGELWSYDKTGKNNPNWKGGVSASLEYRIKRHRRWLDRHPEKREEYKENRRRKLANAKKTKDV